MLHILKISLIFSSSEENNDDKNKKDTEVLAEIDEKSAYNQYLELLNAQNNEKAAYNQYFPSPGAENKYGYVQPGNPVIPLTTGSEDQDYISGKSTNDICNLIMIWLRVKSIEPNSSVFGKGRITDKEMSLGTYL